MHTSLLATGAVVLALATGCAGPSSLAPAAGGTAHPAPGSAGAALTTPGEAPGSPTTARTEIAGLRLAAPHPLSGYSPAAFGLWARQPGHCTTGEEALRRTGQHVVSRPGTCRPRTGRWYSGYDDTTLDGTGGVTVDHVVPLAEAWRSGADSWSPARRAAFGNDLTDPQLVVASRASHTAKGDAGPTRWRPPNRAAWCAYAEDYAHVKARFQLTTTPQERTALSTMLATCPH